MMRAAAHGMMDGTGELPEVLWGGHCGPERLQPCRHKPLKVLFSMIKDRAWSATVALK